MVAYEIESWRVDNGVVELEHQNRDTFKGRKGDSRLNRDYEREKTVGGSKQTSNKK